MACCLTSVARDSLDKFDLHDLDDRPIKTYVYYETFPTHGILYINKVSADLGMLVVEPVPLDADHNTICKPASKTAAVYLRVKRLIKETMEENDNSNIEQAKQSSTRIDPTTAELNMEKETATVSYSGKAKTEFCARLGGDWRQVADLLEIKTSEQARWSRGNEARAIWEWLENRHRLCELPNALKEINRSDLVDTLNSHPK